MNIPPSILRKARKSHGITAKQVSIALGINQFALSQYENGRIEWGHDMVGKYWKYLTVELKIKIRL